MRLLLAIFTLAVLTPAAPAQQAAPSSDDAPAQKQSQAERLQKLRAEFNEAMNAFQKEWQAAQTPADQQKAFAKYPQPKFVGRFLELAEEDPTSPAGLDCLVAAAQMGGPTNLGQKAVNLLIQHHVGSDKIAGVVPILQRMGDRGEAALTELREKGTPAVKLAAALGLASIWKEASENPGREELAAKAEAMFEEVIAGDDQKLAKQARAELFELRNLAVGKPMPELTSQDLDDKEVKLSDYKGKVVVLDVWATWCGPCRAMIPHERKMVARLKDKPFALISVSCDDEKETLVKFLEKEEMPWVHWFDGRGGAVAKALNIRYFPTIYVLDAKGVIRYKGVRGEKMDQAVDELLKEMGAL